MGCPHHAHSDTYKATGDAEVSMLAGSLTATKVVLEVFRAITTNMECALHNEVFQNMVASFTDMACFPRSLAATGLFYFGNDTGI